MFRLTLSVAILRVVWCGVCARARTQAWNASSGKRVGLCRPGHDGPVQWIGACRNNGSALVSIGGSSLKVWDSAGWICVQTVDIRAKPDDVLPRGLPPGAKLDFQQDIAQASGMTMAAASMRPVASSFFSELKGGGSTEAQDAKDLRAANAISDAALIEGATSMHELPSTIMEDLGTMPSMALSVPKSMWGVGTESTTELPGPHAVGTGSAEFDASTLDDSYAGSPSRKAVTVRGIPPHFPHRTKAHGDAKAAMDATRSSPVKRDVPGLLSFEDVDTVLTRPRNVPITDNDFRVALVIEVRGAATS